MDHTERPQFYGLVCIYLSKWLSSSGELKNWMTSIANLYTIYNQEYIEVHISGPDDRLNNN
jgi:hypothetical protein